MEKEKLNEKTLKKLKKAADNACISGISGLYGPYSDPSSETTEAAEIPDPELTHETSSKKDFKKLSKNNQLKSEIKQFISKQTKENNVIKVFVCHKGDEYSKENDYYTGFMSADHMRIKTVYTHTTTVGVVRKSHDGSLLLQIACTRRNPKDDNNKKNGYMCALQRACNYEAEWQLDGKKMQTLSIGPLYDLSLTAKIFNSIARTYNNNFSDIVDIAVEPKRKKRKSIDLTGTTDK